MPRRRRKRLRAVPERRRDSARMLSCCWSADCRGRSARVFAEKAEGEGCGVGVAECDSDADAEVSGVCGGLCRDCHGCGNFGFDGGASASDGAGVVRAGAVGAVGETIVASGSGLGLVDSGDRR
jgi:hypothetical protein